MEPEKTLGVLKQIKAAVRLARRAYRPYRIQIFTLTGLGFTSGILEAIGINAVIPLLTFVLGLHDPATDTLSRAIGAFFAWMHIPFIPRFLLAFIILLFIGKAIVALVLSYIQIRITAEYERATRARLFGVVLRASWPYLLREKLGNIETVLMVDTPASTALLARISVTITLFTSLAMYLIVAFSISALVTLVTALLGALVLLVLRPLMNHIHATSRERTVLYRDTMHHVTEHMGGLKTVKALGVESPIIARAGGLFRRVRDSAVRIQIFQQIAAQVLPPIGIIYIGAILSLALKTPFITLAALPAILYLIYRIFSYIQQLQGNIHAVTELVPHLERVTQYEKGADEQTEVVSGTLPFIFKKELSFKDLSFSYESGGKVLHNISFAIPKGNMVGIVGPSGAGKTTCVDLILRLLESTEGAIELDGVDSRSISLSDWRKHIAYVSQDLFLVHGTIRDNIRFYDEGMSDEEVWKAAEMAHIAEFIRKCPEGLGTRVGERGITLSAGQRQRVVIARALARKPDILILDEATSSLDNESEAHIKRVIEELKGRITIIAIAHRLSTIMDSDTLVALRDGRVVETGKPQELLKDTKSYFSYVSGIHQEL